MDTNEFFYIVYQVELPTSKELMWCWLKLNSKAGEEMLCHYMSGSDIQGCPIAQDK